MASEAQVEPESRPPRERIFDAAREAFRRDGIAGTRLDDIAASAGLSRPNLYRYFPNRKALVVEVLIYEIRQVNAARWRQLTLAGPVRPLILQSLMLGHETAHDDYRELLGFEREALAMTADVASSEPSILEAQFEYWIPVLEYGRVRREIAPHLTNEQIVRWFLAAHVQLAERPELVPNGDVLVWFRDFVVPPVVVTP